uniref:hypothetical protein n=1 Tax=Nocardia wallacei TaxID=480035 RepID=UPI00245387AC
VTLGLLVALQIALGEEPLLIFALAFGLFVLVYYLHRPRTDLRVGRRRAPQYHPPPAPKSVVVGV